MPAAIEAMREAFGRLSGGQVTLPTRERLDSTEGEGVALIMPCHVGSPDLFSVKVVTVFHENAHRNLPLVQSLVILTDGTTGEHLAVMDGASVTAIRTGAASGLATDLLARPDAAAAAVFGAGVQARTQLEAVCGVRAIRRARVHDADSTAAKQFAAEMSEQLGLAVECAATPAEALKEADVVCAATSSVTPVFEDSDLPSGVHINGVGSYRLDMTEIPAATVQRARVVIDHRAAAMEEAGDLVRPLEEGLIEESHFSTELGEVVLGRAPARQSEEEVTLFKSVGVAVQDLFAAAKTLENARRLGLGTRLS